MRRLHSATAVIAGIFVIIMIFILIHPIEWADKDIEDIYHDNEGLFWAIGIMSGAAIFVMTYINGVFVKELNACATENGQKNTQIHLQNEIIIKNQLEYIGEIKELNKTINKNAEKDNDTISMINKLYEHHDAILKRVEGNEAKLKVVLDFDNRFKSIERLLSFHDADIKKINENFSNFINK